MAAILETKGLVMQFGALRAIDHIDLSIEEGELRAIIGPNGAGKSTFFNLVTGFLEPTRGSIFLKGQEIIGLFLIIRKTSPGLAPMALAVGSEELI